MEYLHNFIKVFFIYFIISFVSISFVEAQESSEDYYVGAVVEYNTKYNKSKTVLMNIDDNIAEYLTLISQAKNKNADIVVFPECGLTTVHLPDSPSEVLAYTSVLPDPSQKINPCEKAKGNEISPWANYITRISCSARENKIYVVINLPERYLEDNKDEFLIYNSNLVFDRQGTVIARYRKYNLFNEPAFNITKEPERVTFTTDFGVTFGTFICFDILFADPAMQLAHWENVTDIIYPTAWFSELPFLTAVQTQAGWARANGMNLLASGYNDPANCSGGSGIFSPNKILSYKVPAAKRTSLVVAKVPKIKSKGDQKSFTSTKNMDALEARTLGRLETWNENFTLYTTKLVSEVKSENFELCHGKFCCSFTLKYAAESTSDYVYRLVVYEGKRLCGVDEVNIQICGLVACANETKESCGIRVDSTTNPKQFDEIIIKGSFNKENSTVLFPSAVDYDLDPLPYDGYSYETTMQTCHKEVVMKTTKETSQLLGFGIYGFLKSDAGSSFSMLPLVLVAVVVLLVWNQPFRH